MNAHPPPHGWPGRDLPATGRRRGDPLARWHEPGERFAAPAVAWSHFAARYRCTQNIQNLTAFLTVEPRAVPQHPHPERSMPFRTRVLLLCATALIAAGVLGCASSRLSSKPPPGVHLAGDWK